MFELLDAIYCRSSTEHDIDIIFRSVDGRQENECRSLFCTHLNNPTLESAEQIAARLEHHTDGRSGMGLLFLLSGREGLNKKFVISRFPTDKAIYVDDTSPSLSVQFLERVFLKNKTSYKAVLYQDTSLRSGFWEGKAIDRQSNSSGETSNYWILDFLESDFKVTPAAGTRRLANALKAAVSKAPLSVKNEIVAAATLAVGLKGKPTSVSEFCDKYSLSNDARDAITRQFKNSNVTRERFNFDDKEFGSIIAFRSIELNNGAMLSAPSEDFDKVFQKEQISGKGSLRFSTQGKIVDEKLKSDAR